MSGSVPPTGFDGMHESSDGSVTAAYAVDGWHVLVTWDLFSPYDGPSRVSIEPDTSAEGMDQTAGSEGVTVAVLRSVPMRDAARRIASHLAARAVEALSDAQRGILSQRVESQADHARFAALYVHVRQCDGAVNPVRRLTDMSEHLAKSTGAKPLTRSGVSARIRRARDMGLLNRDTENPALTDAGMELVGEH